MKRPWYQFKAQADPSVAELHVLDAIFPDDPWGDGVVTAKQFVKDLGALAETVKTLKVHINSPGGDVFTAIAIANALRDQRATKGRQVETIVDGLAASAASLILMAGAPIRVADNAMVMVHNPWGACWGFASDMRKAAETLDKIRDTAVATYQWHAKLGAEELVALMDAETWMDADEAIAQGFADEKVEGMKAQASIDPRAMARLKVPERFAGRVAELLHRDEPPAPEPRVATTDEVLALCQAAGLDDLAFAAGLTHARLTHAEASARANAERDRRGAEARRQTDIRALCERFKVPDLAEGLVSGGTSLDGAKAVVMAVKAAVDKVEIDAGLGPDAGASKKPVIDVAAIYRQRNQK